MTERTTPARAVRPPTPADFRHAWEVVAEHLPPTPVLAAGADGPALKLESVQPTGAFKVRGALAALSRIERGTPVVTASAGNHALGVAFAASRLGHHVTMVTATTASPAKVEKIRRYGVDLVQVGTSYDDAEGHALALAAEGRHYLSPYNDPDVIAGQATIGPELEEQLDGPLTVVCPVGGGGMAAGLALWAVGRPEVRVVGVEAEHNQAVRAAIAGHTPVLTPTIADGMAGDLEAGSVTAGLIAEHVADLVTVTEAEIRDAMRHLALDRGVVAEGAGAAATAAVRAGKVLSHGTTVAVVSGRNVTRELLAEVLAGG